MSTTAAATAATPVPEVWVPRYEHAGRVTQARILLSEWTKLHSLRSTRWSFLAATVLGIGLSCIFAAVTASHWSSMSLHDRLDRHPLDIALAGVNVAQLAVAVLGVLVITGEYSTGMIRASLTAVPKRLPVLWAKSAVFAAVTFVLMLPTVLIAFFGSQAILRNHHILQISFTAPGVARSVIGGAGYLVLVGVLALAIGAILRNTAGGIALFVFLLFVLPGITAILPSSVADSISPYLPLNAGTTVASVTFDNSHHLSSWGGFAVFAGYAALAVILAAVGLRRRDA